MFTAVRSYKLRKAALEGQGFRPINFGKYFIECEHQLKTLLKQQKQSPQSTTQAEQPKVIMPTKEEVDYIKSRPWEKAELEGIPVDFDDVATKSGFKRAFGASRGITKS